MALLRVVIALAVLASASSRHAYRERQEKMYASDGCGPNRYALFCMKSGYQLTVADPRSEYVSDIKFKRTYDFLSHSNCYKHMDIFLCAALFPKCTPDPFSLSFPCRKICREAEEACTPVLKKYGAEWPYELNCTNFASHDCIGINVTAEDDASSKSRPDRMPEKSKQGRTQEKGRMEKKRVNTGAESDVREKAGKQGHRNRKHHHSHMAGKSERSHARSPLVETVRAPDGSEKKTAKLMKFRTLLRLLKKTLTNVSANLNTLSDAL